MKTVINELPLLLQGVVVTLQISVLVIVAGSIIGIFGGSVSSMARCGCVHSCAPMSISSAVYRSW